MSAPEEVDNDWFTTKKNKPQDVIDMLNLSHQFPAKILNTFLFLWY